MDKHNSPGHEVASWSTFALSFDADILSIKNDEILNNISTPNLRDFTVEVWLKPEEQAGSAYALGLTGDGRFFAESPGQQRVTSTEPLRIGSWLHLSMAIDGNGLVTLYDDQIALSSITSSSAIQAIVPPAVLTLGSADFIGLITSAVFSDKCKVSKVDLETGKRTVNDSAESIDYAAFHGLPANAMCAFSLMHMDGSHENSNSPILPVCFQIKGRQPAMVPVESSIGIQSITAARNFSTFAYVDCDFFAHGNSQEMCLEGWVMPCITAESRGDLNTPMRRTIASCGVRDSSVEPQFNVGWQFRLELTKEVGEEVGNQSCLVFEKYSDFYHGDANGWSVTASLPFPFVTTDAKWYHVAFNYRGSQAGHDAFELRLNGDKLEIEVAYPLDKGGYSLGSAYQNYPLIVGAQLVSFDLNDRLAGRSHFTQDNWNGYMKSVKIWKSWLTYADLNEWAIPCKDGWAAEKLRLYADLDDPSPNDLTGRNEIRCSPLTSYQANVAVAVRSVNQPSGTTHASILASSGPIIARIWQNQAQERDRLVARTYTTIIAMGAGAGPDDFKKTLGLLLGPKSRLIPLATFMCKTFNTFVSALCNWKANIVKLASTIANFIQKHGATLMAFADAIVAARAVTQNRVSTLLSSILDLIYFVFRTGVLKSILGCFPITWFGLGRLLARCVPYVGTAILVMELTTAFVEFGISVTQFVTGMKALDSTFTGDMPLTLQWTPPVLTQRYDIAVGSTQDPSQQTAKRFSVQLDRQPVGDQVSRLQLRSSPLGVLVVNPNFLRWDAKSWNSKVIVQVMCASYTADGQAALVDELGGEIIRFNLVKSTALTIREAPTVNAVMADDNCTFRINYDWDGVEINVSKKRRNTADREVMVAPQVVKRSRGELISYKDVEKRTAAIKLSETYGSNAGSSVAQKGVKEIVSIYATNAGRGDCYYVHFKRLQPKDDKADEEIGFESTMLVDGANSEKYVKSLWPVVLAEHRPKDSKLNLIVVTHQDTDDVRGLQELYIDMAAKTPIWAELPAITPEMTWMNAPYEKIKSARPMRGNALVNLPLPEHVNMPMVASHVQGIRDVCDLNGWEYQLTPSIRKVPQAMSDAGVEVNYKSPDQRLVDAAASSPEDIPVNRASIVHITRGREYRASSMLWTGDAHDARKIDPKSKSKKPKFSGAYDSRNALGLCNTDGSPLTSIGKEHFKVFKVPHHGSEVSNSPELFASITAHHYLVSCNGASDNPKEATLQWILDGHAAMMVDGGEAAGRPHCTIWVNNPAKQGTEWTVTYRHTDQRILYRNEQRVSGSRYSGTLMFQIVNGVLARDKEPFILSKPSAQQADLNKVLKLPGNVRSVKRDRLAGPPFWEPPSNSVWQSMIEDELKEVTRSLTRLYLLRLVYTEIVPPLANRTQPKDERFWSDSQKLFTEDPEHRKAISAIWCRTIRTAAKPDASGSDVLHDLAFLKPGEGLRKQPVIPEDRQYISSLKLDQDEHVIKIEVATYAVAVWIPCVSAVRMTTNKKQVWDAAGNWDTVTTTPRAPTWEQVSLWEFNAPENHMLAGFRKGYWSLTGRLSFMDGPENISTGVYLESPTLASLGFIWQEKAASAFDNS